MIERLLDKDFFTSKQQTIAIEPRAPQPIYPEHTHNFNEIVIVTHGSGKHILNGHYFELYPGMMFYVDANDHHLYEEVDNLHLTNVLFRQPEHFKFINGIHDMLPINDKEQSHFFIDEKHIDTINNILTSFNYLLGQKEPNQIQCESLFLQLLISLKQNQYVNTGSGSIDNRVKQLLSWLTINYQQEIDWSEVTQQFSLSLRTFHRYLKSRFNSTPQKYLTKIRLAEAYHQLRYTDKSVIDIAQNCGFNDSNYFATCFKQEFSITPTQHRNSFN